MRLRDAGRYFDRPDLPQHKAFRIPLVHGERIRDGDELIQSLTNRACSVLTPIALLSWCHVAHISTLLSAARRPLALGKAGESEDYKKKPPLPADAPRGVVDSAVPDGRWYGNLSRTRADFWRNGRIGALYLLVSLSIGFILSIILDSRCRRSRRLRLRPSRERYGHRPVHLFEPLSLTGVRLPPKKRMVGTINALLGLRGSLHSADNRFSLSLCLGPETAADWPAMAAGVTRS